MTFALLKTIAWLALPSTLVILALIAGVALLWLGARRLGRILVTAGMLVALVPAALPLFDLLALPLENAHPIPDPQERVDGIVVLGGAVVQGVTAARDQVGLGAAAERMTEALRLANAHPEATLLFSGGSGLLKEEALSEADVAERFFLEHGIDPARLVLEDRSRDTAENARLAFEAAQPGPDERWLLVTSAMHMPRAAASFEAAGWDVLPYPTDFQTTGEVRWRPSPDVVAKLHELDAVVREWTALAGYRILGRIDTPALRATDGTNVQ